MEVLKSLPGGIWDTYGVSGWGPNGTYSFMEFDYGAFDWEGLANRNLNSGSEQEVDAQSRQSRQRSQARDLFEGDSCQWTKFYANEEMLRKVQYLYQEDYDMFGWYDVDYWVTRQRVCLENFT